MKAILTYMVIKAILVGLIIGSAGCSNDSETPVDPAPYTDDAQYICNTLLTCFGLAVPDCAATIRATTSPVNVSTCAGCYEQATCDAIGGLGTPGVCDLACNDALFGGPQ